MAIRCQPSQGPVCCLVCRNRIWIESVDDACEQPAWLCGWANNREHDVPTTTPHFGLRVESVEKRELPRQGIG